jgi:hypothetical protein
MKKLTGWQQSVSHIFSKKFSKAENILKDKHNCRWISD